MSSTPVDSRPGSRPRTRLFAVATAFALSIGFLVAGVSSRAQADEPKAAPTATATAPTVKAPTVKAPTVKAPTVKAPAVTAPAPPPFSVRTGVIFNQPNGTPVQRGAIADYLMKSIDAAPKGSTIRIAVYSWSLRSTTQSVINAKRRGVNVKILVDHHQVSPEILQMRKALGTDKSRPSFITYCKRACMSNYKPSYMHSKFYQFSRVGGARYVTMIGTPNPSLSARAAWNDLYTVVNDTTMYEANKKYFNDLIKDRSNLDYYWTSKSTKNRLLEYFFPRAWSKQTPDTMLKILDGIRCTGAAKGYGRRGRTVIRLAMFRWTYGRVRLARKLWDLDNAGCDVQIIYTADVVEKKVVAALTRKGGRGGGIPIYDGRYDGNNDGILDTYVHHKFLTVDGVYHGNPRSKIVWSGSANWTNASQRYYDEQMLRISSWSITTAYVRNFNLIRDHYTYPVKGSPAYVPKNPASTMRTFGPTQQGTEQPSEAPMPRSTKHYKWLGDE